MELWRQCVTWLIDTGVLPRQHRTSQSYAAVFDLAQTLRDGVVLCNLLNIIKPGAVDYNNINLRPQMLQFLCMQNIRTVLHSLDTVFTIHPEQLFQPEDLYKMNDFASVLRTLSILSQLPIAQSRFRPFAENVHQLSSSYRDEEEDIYRNLPDMASDRELADEEDLYDCVAEDKEEEGIYGSLIAAKPAVSPTKDQRSCCISEILQTERNYVGHLEMMMHKFYEPMKSRLELKDLQTLFINTDQLLAEHRDFLSELEQAKNSSGLKLSSPFLDYKNRFLIYGTYCSRMTDAQDVVAILTKKEEMRQFIEELQSLASPSKFRLRELLCVPMQRVLKYHLLVKELNKHTNESHPDKKDLLKALEAMQELSHYVNEVKRDSEMLVTINKVDVCLTDYNSQVPLSNYGRLLRDGELKIKSAVDRNAKQRNTFLFDQALFMTKAEKNGTYSLKDLVRLQDYKLEDKSQGKGGKWSWQMTLVSPNLETYTLIAKTAADKAKWVEGIQIAFDNLNPRDLQSKQHSFIMKTFADPTYCSNCEKLLLGSFFQGYQCQKSMVRCHKRCLAETQRKIETNSLRSPALIDERPTTQSRRPHPPIRKHPTIASPFHFNNAPPPVQPRAHSIVGVPSHATSYRAHRDYHGEPPPPFPGASVITFSAGEQIEVTDEVNAQWWVGNAISQFDRKGYFPASYVSPMGSKPNRPARPDNYLMTRPALPHPGNRPCLPINPPGSPRNPPQKLEDHIWYAGQVNRIEAEGMLQGKPSGTFLVRTRDGHLAISLVFRSELKHIKINRSLDGLFFVAECKNFRSVQDLIKHYQENSMSSSFLGLETTLKIPYREPNFFPGMPSPVPASRRDRARPPPQVDQISNGIQKITVSGKTYDLMCQVRVRFDFEPRSHQEIGLKEGQTVNVISKAGDAHGWWKGECDGRVGYFPSSFIAEHD